MNETRASQALRAGVAVVAACGLFAASSLAAQGARDRQLVEAQTAPTGIDFVSLQAHGGAILKVSAGEVVHRYTFGPDESPWLSLFDRDGEPLADGVYTWELELLPVADDRADLMRSAAKNRGDAPEALNRQNGSFAIVGGYLADPAIGEPRPPRMAPSRSTEAHDDAAAPARGQQTDSDSAVIAGAVEKRAPTSAAPPAAERAARAAYDDSDEMVAAGMAAERRGSDNE